METRQFSRLAAKYTHDTDTDTDTDTDNSLF